MKKWLEQIISIMCLNPGWDATEEAEVPDSSCISWALNLAIWADQIKCSEHGWWEIDVYGYADNGISVSIWNNYSSKYCDNEVTLYKYNGNRKEVDVILSSPNGIVDSFLVVYDSDNNKLKELEGNKVKFISPKDLFDTIINFMVLDQVIWPSPV